MSWLGSNGFASHAFSSHAFGGARGGAATGRLIAKSGQRIVDEGWVLVADLDGDDARERKRREKDERRAAYLAGQAALRERAETARAEKSRRDPPRRDPERRRATSRDSARLALERLEWEIARAREGAQAPAHEPATSPQRRAEIAPPERTTLDSTAENRVEVKRQGTVVAKARVRVVHAHPRQRALLGASWPILRARPRSPRTSSS